MCFGVEGPRERSEALGIQLKLNLAPFTLGFVKFVFLIFLVFGRTSNSLAPLHMFIYVNLRIC